MHSATRGALPPSALPREADSKGAQSTENTPIPVASNDSQANPIISNSDRMTEDSSSRDSHVQITQYDLDINENQASSPSLEQNNNNETATTFSPLENFDIDANNIYESGASYSENNIISQSQDPGESEANTSQMPTPIDLGTSDLRRSKRIAKLKEKGIKTTYAPQVGIQ